MGNLGLSIRTHHRSRPLLTSGDRLASPLVLAVPLSALFLFVPGRLQVNLVGAMRVTQAFLPLLRKGAAPRLPVPCSHFHTPLLLFLSSCAHSGSSPGRIINMSSQVGGGQQGATS